MTVTELLGVATPLLIVVVVVLVLLRRRGEKKGRRCWNCGADLRGTSHIDLRGEWRCPKCGDLIDADEPGRVDWL